MTAPRLTIIDHLERQRTTITLVRGLLKVMHEEDRAQIDAHLDTIDKEVDAIANLVRDVVCDATATIDRLT